MREIVRVEEIPTQHLDQLVCIEVTEESEDGQPEAGCLIAHGPEKRAVIEEAVKFRGDSPQSRGFIFFTGELIPRGTVVILCHMHLYHPERMQEVMIAGRTVIMAPVVMLREVRVGTFWVNNLESIVLEFPPKLRIDGLLGVNFLERFRPTFEFDTATLVLRGRR